MPLRGTSRRSRTAVRGRAKDNKQEPILMSVTTPRPRTRAALKTPSTPVSAAALKKTLETQPEAHLPPLLLLPSRVREPFSFQM
jgi:hypothetical protein